MVIECLDYHGEIKSALDLDKLNEKCKYLHVDRVKARFKLTLGILVLKIKILMIKWSKKKS